MPVGLLLILLTGLFPHPQQDHRAPISYPHNPPHRSATRQSFLSCGESHLALHLVLLCWPADDVDLGGGETQNVVHRDVLHGTVGSTDFDVALKGRKRDMVRVSHIACRRGQWPIIAGLLCFWFADSSLKTHLVMDSKAETGSLVA